MSNRVRAYIRASAAVFMGFGALSFATSASAACGDTGLTHSAAWLGGASSGSLGALFHEASEDNPGNHAIVGMWSFKMAAAGGFSDYGYQQWHSDGTEFMNSGGRAPSTQNYCLGVWKQVGPSRYHLNHFALSYDTSGTPNARVNIKEDVTLNPSRTSYSGTFTIDVYDPTGTTKVAPTTSGQVTAERVPAN